MGIRETLNENPGITTGLTAGIIVIALGIIIWQTVASSSRPTSMTKSFFSDDNGASYFVDSSNHIPPFDHNGKQAVHANVFTCDDNKTKFIGYLDRYTAAFKAKIEAANAAKKPDLGLMQEATSSGVEVAAPKSDHWVSRSSPEAQRMMESVKCPDGTQNNLTVAWP